MSDEWLEQLECQFAALPTSVLPVGMRAAVLADVERELRAARWDRRSGWVAVGLLMIGLGLNFSAGWQLGGSLNGRHENVAQSEVRPSLVDTAVIVAEATNAETARRFARQLAAMSGRELTADEAAAIDAAIHQNGRGSTGNRRG